MHYLPQCCLEAHRTGKDSSYHSRVTSWSKQSKMEVHSHNLAYWKLDSLLYWDISHSNLRYEHVYHIGILKEFVCEMCLYINCLSPNLNNLLLMSWPLNRHIFTFIKLLTIFSAIFMSLWIIINSKTNITVSKYYWVNNAMYDEWIMKTNKYHSTITILNWLIDNLISVR